MGYRNYIGTMSKERHTEIKNMSTDELLKWQDKFTEDYGYVSVSEVANELYGFGKGIEFADEKYYSPVFDNDDTQSDITEEHDFYIVGKEFVQHIIEHYEEKVKSHYLELLEGIDDPMKIPHEKALALWHQIDRLSSEWNDMKPYNLKKGDEVTTSWRYEYVQFELVRIYKTFDWENNFMIYYGW